MNEVKPGKKTTEFYMVALVNAVAAIVSILAIRGLVTAEEGELYIALVAAVAPIVMAYTTAQYAQARAQVKTGGG